MWIHKYMHFMYEFMKEIWVMILLNSLQYIQCHISLLNSILWIPNIEFSSIFSNEFIIIISYYEFIIMKSWIQIEYNKFLYLNSYILNSSSYMNSDSIHLNSYTWIHILMDSYIFISLWIQLDMNAYHHFIYEFI